MPRSNDGRWTRQCEVCGQEFQQRKPSQRTCSIACRALLPHHTGGRRAKADLAVRQCQNPECRCEYQPVRENQIACSRACLLKTSQYQAAQRRTDSRPERRARQNDLRRPSNPDSSSQRVETVQRYQRKQQLAKAGWTLELYDEKLAEQDGRCMLCGRLPKPDGIKAASKLHADHDHETGKRRDLLCGSCNSGLGLFNDDPGLLRAAADYIERHRAGVV